MSETRDNILDPVSTQTERPALMCKRLSTPDLLGSAATGPGAVGWSAGGQGHSPAVRTAVMVSRRGYRHEVTLPIRWTFSFCVETGHSASMWNSLKIQSSKAWLERQITISHKKAQYIPTALGTYWTLFERTLL